jgi:hypothetical protein
MDFYSISDLRLQIAQRRNGGRIGSVQSEIGNRTSAIVLLEPL